MFIKKSIILVIIGVLFLSSTVFQLVGPIMPTVQAESGYQWIDAIPYDILEDEDAFNLSGDRLETALAQYEASAGRDPSVGTYIIGYNCSDTATLTARGTPVCDRYYFFAESRGINPPFFHNFCQLDDSCSEPESISLESLTSGCRYISFSDAENCTARITINNPFRVARFVADEYDIDFENIDPIPGIDGGRTEPPGGDRIDGDEEGDEDDTPKCEEEFDEAEGAWFICLVIDFVDARTEQWIDKVDELLSVGGDEYNTDEMRKAWSYFRNIASLLLMAIGLVMIIGQSISKE